MLLRVAALTLLGVIPVLSYYCGDATTCATCTNIKCRFCPQSEGGADPGDCSACVPGTDCHTRSCKRDNRWYPLITDRSLCHPIQCKQCTNDNNKFRVIFGAGAITTACVLASDCTDEDHVVGTVRCYREETCGELERRGDSRLLTEGQYEYSDGSCFEREDCYACLDGTGKCEWFTETPSGEETAGCVPARLLAPSETLKQIPVCPCSQEKTCAQCLNQASCVFCADDSGGNSGSCRASSCPSDTTLLHDRNLCPPITCEECTRTANDFQLTYKANGIALKCVGDETARCAAEDHAVNTVRCYNRGSCSVLRKLDARLSSEGEYPYLEGACFEKSCNECLDGTSVCEYFVEFVSGVRSAGCVPPGLLKPTTDLIKTEECPERSACQDCANNQVYRVRYGTTGVHTSCVEHCTPIQLPVSTTFCYDKTMCPHVDNSLIRSGFYSYPIESCFTKVCSACEATIDESGNPLCQFLIKGAEGTGSNSVCVPVGFISSNDLYEPESCPSANAAEGVGSFIVAICAILVAFVLTS